MAESEQVGAAAKKQRARSPGYPGIDLKLSIEKARLLHKAEGRNATPYSVALKDIGYSEKSGAGWAAMAALIKFGLVSEEGTGPGRKIRLSDAGFRIVIDAREDSSERDALIREAAMLPSIHREIWSKYEGDLPANDANIEYYLKAERGFTETGAKDFIREFRATLAYANVSAGDGLTRDAEDSNDGMTLKLPAIREHGEVERVTQPPAPLNLKEQRQLFQFPVSPTRVVALDTPFPLEPAEWNQLMNVLRAMQPAIAPPQPSHPIPEATHESFAGGTDDQDEELTFEALELIDKVDSGGVPAYRTPNLERIAHENGLDVSPEMTPNEIVEKLRLLRDR
jgi:hypothetical protein